VGQPHLCSPYLPSQENQTAIKPALPPRFQRKSTLLTPGLGRTIISYSCPFAILLHS
jgi:hypothetical protein